LTLHVTQCN